MVCPRGHARLPSACRQGEEGGYRSQEATEGGGYVEGELEGKETEAEHEGD